MKVSIVGSLRDREVACSASDRQGSNFESCVWRTVSSQSSHHPQEVLLAQFSLYVHKGGLKPDSFHFIYYGSVDHLPSHNCKNLTSKKTTMLTICDAGPASNHHRISAPCLCHHLPVGKVRLRLRRLNPLCVDDNYIIFNIFLIFQ